MKRIEYLKTDLSSLPIPQLGYKTIGIDTDGVVKTIDDQGTIEGIGGGSDGNGIYDVANGGSGTVPSGAVATLTDSLVFTNNTVQFTKIQLNNTQSSGASQFEMIGSDGAYSQKINYNPTVNGGWLTNSFGDLYYNRIYNLAFQGFGNTSTNVWQVKTTPTDSISGHVTRMLMNGNGEFNIGQNNPVAGVKLRVEGDTQIDGELTINAASAGTIGHVWTSTGINGEGNWAAPATPSVDTLYSANSTIGAGRVATLTDSLTLQSGANGKIEFTNSSIEIFRELNGNSFFKVVDSGEASTLLLNSDGGRKVSLSTESGGSNVLYNNTTIGYENPIAGSTLALRSTAGAKLRGYHSDLTKPTFEIGAIGAYGERGELKLWHTGSGPNGETFVKLTSITDVGSSNYLYNKTGIGFYNLTEGSVNAALHIRAAFTGNAFLIQNSALNTDFVKVLTGNGYMGLGVDPTAKLHVGGDTQIDGGLQINTATASVVGEVWTATDTVGNGEWAAVATPSVDTIFTGGTMTADSTITMATNDVTFSGGKVKTDDMFYKSTVGYTPTAGYGLWLHGFNTYIARFMARIGTSAIMDIRATGIGVRMDYVNNQSLSVSSFVGSGTAQARVLTMYDSDRTTQRASFTALGKLGLGNWGTGRLTASFASQAGWLNVSASTTGHPSFWLEEGVAPTTPSDGYEWLTATERSFRVNGNTIKLYQETTGVTAETFTANTSGIVDDTATWGGYTIGQVVGALKAQGLLA